MANPADLFTALASTGASKSTSAGAFQSGNIMHDATTAAAGEAAAPAPAVATDADRKRLDLDIEILELEIAIAKAEAAQGYAAPVEEDKGLTWDEFNSPDFYEKQVSPRLQAAAQGISLGTADEGYAALTEFLANQQNADILGDDVTAGPNGRSAFQDARAEMREKRDEFAANNPEEALAWEIGGSLLLPGLSGVRGVKNLATAIKGKQGIKRIGQSAALASGVAGAEGALYGAGVADGKEDILWSMAKYGLGAAVGGGLLGSLATTAAIGAEKAAPIVGKAANELGTYLSAKARGKAGKDQPLTDHDLINKIQDEIAVEIMDNPGRPPQMSIDAAIRAVGADPQEVVDASQRARKGLMIPSPEAAAEIADQVRRLRTPSATELASGNQFTEFMADALGSISTRVRAVNQAAFNRLMKFEKELSVDMSRVMESVKGIEKLDTKALRPLARAVDERMLNQDWDGAISILEEHGDDAITNGFRAAREHIVALAGDDAADPRTWASVNRTVPQNPNYVPKSVRSIDEFKAAMGKEERSAVKTALDKARTKKGKALTEREEENIYNRALERHLFEGVAAKPGNLKQRTIHNVSSAAAPLYNTSAVTLVRYLKDSVEDKATRRFFGKSAQTGIDGEDLDIEESLGAMLRDDPDLTGAQVAKLTKLFNARFTASKTSPDAWAQDLKNIGLMTAIGTPKSAMIQIADIGQSVYMNGIANTAKAFLPKNRKAANTTVLGLQDIISTELDSTRKTARVLDKVLKGTGFKALDKFGKNTFMTAALKKAQGQAAAPLDSKKFAKLKDKWEPVFGKDGFPDFVEQLKSGEVTDDVELYLWHTLSEVQPISMSEMPLNYLKAKNGRLAYALKSFALKQLDVMNRNIYQEFQKGNHAEATKQLLAYTAVTGGATLLTDEVRNAIMTLGEDPIELDAHNIPRELVGHLLGNVGFMNKYSLQASGGDLTKAIGSGLLPPLGMPGAVVQDLSSLYNSGDIDVANSATVKAIPGGIGQTLANFWGDGAKKAKERERRDD